jgi:sialate O-acetylesterase
MKSAILFLMLLFFMQVVNGQGKFIRMPAIFSDNMVLQQKSEVNFWGKALPGEKVLIESGFSQKRQTVVQKDSIWKTSLKTPKAGGPYVVNIRIGDSIIVYKNVMIGEVWLCSGQSNMEMPLTGWPPRDTITNSAEEIKNASNNNIRLFTVARAYSNIPEFNCDGSWVESSPETAAKFSATAYFFGKKLYNELRVPIGLISSNWGGTAVESWISKKYLRSQPEYLPVINKIDSSGEGIKKVNAWLKNFPVIDMTKIQGENKWEVLDFNDKECSLPTFDDSRWPEMKLPAYFETILGEFDGVVWFRKKIEIPSGWLNKDLAIELGPIDDMDATFINGIKVGGYEKEGFWQANRIYNVPAEMVTDTTLVIAVRVIDLQGGGGIYGAKEKLKIYLKNSSEKISLNGGWKYLPVAEYSNSKFFVFGPKDEIYLTKPKLAFYLSAYVPTTLFNGMISPLIPYTIKGVIWYQGEANTGEPEKYRNLFSLMIKNWREDWGEGNFPFYFVQIAPYDYGKQTRSERLREAQLFSLSVPNTGMAVTMDIGNPSNIHPADKKDVGCRLAYWALAKNYDKKVYYSGPIYKSMKISKDKIILSFDYADGGLVLKDRNGENNFEIAGEDKVFKKAEIKIDNQKLIVFNPEVDKPVAVRYAWTNTSEATLFNKKDLPASSFRTDNWDN